MLELLEILSLQRRLLLFGIMVQQLIIVVPVHLILESWIQLLLV